MSSHNHTIALIGNPNCGKTTVFNALTGSKQRVGNWAGVTVDKKSGYFVENGEKIEVIDLPGTYAFETDQENISQDELVVRNFLHQDKTSLLINILDASNLQRNLYLTFQLLDLKRPMIIVLNMMDMAKMEGYEIYVNLLQERLGCPVVPVSASKKQGIDELKKIIVSYDAAQYTPAKIPTMGARVNDEIEKMLTLLPANSDLHSVNSWEMLELLEGVSLPNVTVSEHDRWHLDECRGLIAEAAEGEFDIAIASSRYEAIDLLAKDTVKTVGIASSALTNNIDRWALGRFTGIPIFLLVMFIMFVLAINVGTSFNDFIEILFGAIFVDGTTFLLESINSPGWLIAILANGIGEGIKTVASFIPVIGAMFLCLSFLEDSGYLARAAMVVDRGMRAIGLPGKAFVPMLVGFGCNIPAIMGTRTLESNRDRLMSIMMIPFMSCGARLPVYALFAAVFFPTNGGAVVYFLYLLGIVVAIITGFALKFSILKGPNTPFIMELPAYHLPTFKGLMLLTWDRLKSFIQKAGKAIIIVVALLGVLNSWGTDGSFGNQDSDRSVLSSIGKTITPAFKPMGLTEENWPATVGIFTGIFAKEAVIGTLNSLYSQMDAAEGGDDEPFNLWASTKEAFATIPENLSDLPKRLLDPLGISEQMAGGDLAAVQEENEIDDSAVRHIELLFPSSAAVMAYLIFILLYTPCVAALGAIYREAGVRWTFLVAIWTFLIGWILATGYYQLSLLGGEHSTSALYWLIGLAVMIVATFGILRLLGRYNLLESSHKTISESHLTPKSGGSCC